MKLLLLSTATGQGHNSASRAVEEAVRAAGGETVLMDVLKNGKKRRASGRVSALYAGVTVRAPWLFGFAYHLGELVSSPVRHSPIYYLNTLYAERLLDKIEAVGPDVIACPHIFSAQAVTFLREKYGLSIPAAGIMTDYTCSPFWEETRLDRYMIPSPALWKEFAGKGVPEDKMVPLGIPVDARFRKKAAKARARAAFGLSARYVFVLMGGSMGYGDFRGMAAALLERMPEAQVAAACGSNETLYRRMQGISGVKAFRYLENAELLMDAADVLVTKPGGLSSTEALVKRVPVVFSRPIPGGEERNAEFLCALGVAARGGGIRQTADAACRLARDETLARRMLAAQREQIPQDSDEKISRLLFEMAGGAGALRRGNAPCL